MSEESDVSAQDTSEMENQSLSEKDLPSTTESNRELDSDLQQPKEDATEPDHEDSVEDHEDEDLNEKKSKTSGGFTGRGVTLQMLLADNILQAKEAAMSLEYMGQKFIGDLLPDGRIRSAEVQEIFSSPSAWALRCKKIVNPEQKYGCGWSSVRYCGRPLDVYKNQWMRKRRMEQVNDTTIYGNCSAIADNAPISEPKFKLIAIDRAVVKHETLGNRSTVEDPNTLVETMAFTMVGKLQPFLISLHTAALVLIDVHCSLTSSEVVGYLAGSWDMNNNTLTVKRSYPCLSRLGDGTRGLACETSIAEDMERRGLYLVGWYHSHPLAPPTPTVKDIDAQLEYQLKLKGTGEQGYRPCIGIICSPYYRTDSSLQSLACPLSCYWVSPPPESRPQELARPMAMQHNVIFDPSLEDDVIQQIEICLQHYIDAPDQVPFNETWVDNITILEKLKASVTCKLRNENDISVLELLDKLIKEQDTKKPRVDVAAKPLVDVNSVLCSS